MSLYLDTSVLVALFTADAHADEAAHRFGSTAIALVVSDFGVAEFASALGLRQRRGDLTNGEARTACAALDAALAVGLRRIELQPADIARAGLWLRRFDLALRTPDALHLAIAARLGAPVATFDRGMAQAARSLGLALAPA